MANIEIPNVRQESTVLMPTTLKDNGVAVDWSGLQNIKAYMYSDAQRVIAGKCDVEVDGEDATVLKVTYAATRPQYLGVNSLLVRCKYQGREKSYDVPVLNFVERTAQATGVTELDDPVIDVEIEVDEVSTSLLDGAIAAALDAAVKAEEAASLVPLQVLEDCVEATENAETATAAANEAAAAANAAGITSVQASVADNEPGTPSVDAALLNKVLSLVFHHLRGAKGDTGATPNISVGTVTTGAPGTPVVITMTGTAAAPVLNITIPQGLKGEKGEKGDQGNTGSSVEFPYELVNNLTTNDPTKGLSAAQGVVLNDKIDNIAYQKGDALSVDSTADSWQLKGDGYSQSNTLARMRKFKVAAGSALYLKLSKDTPGVYQFQNAASVPSSGTSKVVGSPVTEAVDGFVTVPVGATYLIISELKTNTTNEVKAATTLADSIKSQIDVPLNGMQFKNNRYINNNGAYVEDANWAVTPKIPCQQGDYVVWASGYGSSSSVISIVIFDAAGNKLAYYARSNQSYRDFSVTQEGAAYVIASFYKGATTGYLEIGGLVIARMDSDTLLRLSEQQVEVLDNDIIANNIRKEPALASVAAYYGNSNLKVAGKITLLHFSDIHGNTVNLSRVVRYWKHYPSIFSDIIHTGDIVGGLFTDADPFQSVPGAEDILNLIGNHDAWLSSSDPDYDATEKQCYDKFFAPNIANWDVVQPSGAAENGYCYYYKDYTTEGYRLIVLDSVHWHYRNGVAQENAAQKAWLEATLADAKTQGLTVICATHYTPQNGITPIPDTGFNLLGATPGGNIADGWYASDEMFDCVDDFIESGGVFAGWLIGHTHTDYIGTVYGHSSQPIVIVGTSGSTSVNNKFITGTASQDNFNAITFENISNKAIVKIVKIGQDTDLYTRSKATIAYNYTDGVLISTT